LGSWIEQNRKHGEKFEKWKQKTGNPGEGGAYGPVFEAVERVEEASKELSKALSELGET
jgi:hypothetical protein